MTTASSTPRHFRILLLGLLILAASQTATVLFFLYRTPSEVRTARIVLVGSDGRVVGEWASNSYSEEQGGPTYHSSILTVGESGKHEAVIVAKGGPGLHGASVTLGAWAPERGAFSELSAAVLESRDPTADGPTHRAARITGTTGQAIGLPRTAEFVKSQTIESEFDLLSAADFAWAQVRVSEPEEVFTAELSATGSASRAAASRSGPPEKAHGTWVRPTVRSASLDVQRGEMSGRQFDHACVNAERTGRSWSRCAAGGLPTPR